MPVLKDSGGRTEFESGAVRDLQGHKGRMDLFPLSVMSKLFERSGNNKISEIVANVDKFLYSLNTKYLLNAYFLFIDIRGWTLEESLIEVSKHYEDGAVKYGTHNWEKGIPLHSFIDSGIRHLDQWTMKDQSDPHDRAFLWNMIGAIWTVEHKPDMIDTPMHKWDCKTPYTNFDYERACTKCRDANDAPNDATSYDPAAVAVPDGAAADCFIASEGPSRYDLYGQSTTDGLAHPDNGVSITQTAKWNCVHSEPVAGTFSPSADNLV